MPAAAALRLDWLVGPSGPLLDTPGQVALSSCPGRLDLGGTVRDDIERLASQGIRVVVSLVDDREMEFYGAFGLRAALRESGLRSLHLPLVDAQPPEDLFSARNLCGQLLGWLGEGEHVLIHCIGGWGRSGTVAASLLTHQGYDAATAIRLVRQARSPRCVESRAQEDFVRAYADAQRDYERYYYLTRRPQLADLLTGVPGARRLRQRLLPEQARLTAAQLMAQLPALLGDPAGAQCAADLVVFSGELPRTIPSSAIASGAASAAAAAPVTARVSDCPVDRAFALQDRVWRAVPLAGLSK